MDFLNKIYFDNTGKSYLAVTGVILFTLLAKRYLSRPILSAFLKLVKKKWAIINRTSFINTVAPPLEWFLVIIISIFAIDKLNFPSALDFEIYGHTVKDILSRIGPGIIIIAFIWLLLGIIDFIALTLEKQASLTQDKKDDQLVVFFRDFFKAIVIIGGILLIIKASFRQPIGGILTSLSIVGAALALAAKESLENLIASFIIFFDKPFFAGDTVKVNNVTGTIERIGLRSTRIRTGDKTLVTMPNKQMVDSAVDNWSMRTERRTEIKLELSAKTTQQTLQQLTETIKNILSKNSTITSAEVFVKEISRNAIVLSVEYFTQPILLAEFNQTKNDINLQIKKLLEEKEIEFAGESSLVVIKNDAE